MTSQLALFKSPISLTQNLISSVIKFILDHTQHHYSISYFISLYSFSNQGLINFNCAISTGFALLYLSCI